MELDRLANLLALLQASGVTRYRDADLELELGAAARSPDEDEETKPAKADGFEWENRPAMRQPTDAERMQRSRRAGT